MKRSATSGSSIPPDGKLARGDSNEDTIENIQEDTETPATEPNLKDIHNILKSIQSAIGDMQGTIAMLVKENNKLSGDVADLRHILQRTTTKLKSSREIS